MQSGVEKNRGRTKTLSTSSRSNYFLRLFGTICKIRVTRPANTKTCASYIMRTIVLRTIKNYISDPKKKTKKKKTTRLSQRVCSVVP